MKASEQGAGEPGRPRYQVIPRTLIFLTSRNPESGAREVLLIKGAPAKRLWANHYNGLGGHVEADEDVLAAAQREVVEESGLVDVRLTLRGVVNIDAGHDELGPRPGVLMFVFCGESQERQVHTTHEGAPEWAPVDALANYPLVDDLYKVIPLALAAQAPFFGHYTPNPDGTMEYRFTKG